MNQLTVVQRAQVALGTTEREKALIELAQASVSITAITNPDGYKECHAARMRLKTARTDLEKTGKESREDAQKFAKAVIAEEARLVALIEPEEKRLERLQKEWDEARERERQEKARIEAERVAGIRAKIEDIRGAILFAGSESAKIQSSIDELLQREITIDEFAEFAGEAQAALEMTAARLNKALAEAKTREAEQERVRLERIELARLRKAEAEKDAEIARLKREQIAAEQREAAERRRIADKAAEAERQRVAALATKEAMTRAQQVEPLQVPLDKPRIKLATGEVVQRARVVRPTDDMIIKSLELDFKVDRATVIEWLRGMNLEAIAA